SDAVLVVVGFDAEVERVVFGAGGVAAAARPGLILAIGSTIAPSYARRMAERLQGSGILLIDMALTRGEPFAEAGTMLCLGHLPPWGVRRGANRQDGQQLDPLGLHDGE